MEEEVRHVSEMLQKGVIKESNINNSSNVLFLKKTDGSLGFCIDIRVLN
jgi:hypothetical protein